MHHETKDFLVLGAKKLKSKASLFSIAMQFKAGIKLWHCLNEKHIDDNGMEI